MNEQELNMIKSELRAFLDEELNLTAMPAKRKKQLLGLYLIADRLPADGEWTERELNGVLNSMHAFGDPATIRRVLHALYRARGQAGACGVPAARAELTEVRNDLL